MKRIKCCNDSFYISRAAGPEKSRGEDHKVSNLNITGYLLSKKDQGHPRKPHEKAEDFPFRNPVSRNEIVGQKKDKKRLKINQQVSPGGIGFREAEIEQCHFRDRK